MPDGSPVLNALLKDAFADPRELGPALNDATSREWLDWLPEVLREWYPVEPVGANDEKCLAIQVAYTNPDVFEDWHLLVPVVHALSHRSPDVEHFEPPTTAELAWGLTCLRSLCPGGQLVGDALKFVGITAAEDGLLVFPWADDLNVAEHPAFKGLYAQDAEAREMAAAALRIFKQGSLPEEFTHNELDPLESQLARLFDIAAVVKKGFRA